MGVMECSRGNCWRVCCDYYSDKYGYLCDPCFKELCTIPPNTVDIEGFMETNPPDCDLGVANRAYYSEIFHNRHSEDDDG